MTKMPAIAIAITDVHGDAMRYFVRPRCDVVRSLGHALPRILRPADLTSSPELRRAALHITLFSYLHLGVRHQDIIDAEC